MSKTCWLVLCVIIFYWDFSAMALKLKENAYHWRNRSNKGSFKDNTGHHCDKWEEYDGVECRCADEQQYRCEGESGVVCDNQGIQYKSNCHFAESICNRHIPLTRTIESCGACKFLKLTNSKTHDQMSSMYFQKVTNRNSVFFRSLQDNKEVFFDDTLNLWAIGIRNASGSFVSMIQEVRAEFPQDSDGGMMVVSGMNGSRAKITINPFLRLECTSGDLRTMNVTKRTVDKRFIFTLFAVATIVTVAAVTTSTTLKIVQAAKGCLYYPSVCALRDEIKNSLKPQVLSLKKSFFRKYGDPDSIQENVKQIQELVFDIKETIITIKDLHVKANSCLSELSIRMGTLQFNAPDNDFTEYEQWANRTLQSIPLTIISMNVELGLLAISLNSIVTSSVSALAAGVAVLSAVVAVGLAIVDVVSSVLEEKEVKHKLERARTEYIKARTQLQNAHTHMEILQKTFCKTVISYLRNLSKRGKNVDKVFSNLYKRIISIYGTRDSGCNNRGIYSKTTEKVLKLLRVSYIIPLFKYLKKNVSTLKDRIRDIRIMKHHLDVVHSRVKVERIKPTQVFNDIKLFDHHLTQILFKNLFKFLAYIAKEVLPNTLCYWGHNLHLIRLGKTTFDNYLNATICKSQEIKELTNMILDGVRDRTIPCIIYQKVKGSIFRSKYLVLRFIADHVSPRGSCYWGYNLNDIRVNQMVHEIERAKISSRLFTFLGIKAQRGTCSSEQTFKRLNVELCSKYYICDKNWKLFILCSVFKKYDVKIPRCNTNLSKLDSGDGCIPPITDVQKCASART